MDSDPTVVPIVTFSSTELEESVMSEGAAFGDSVSYQVILEEPEMISISPSPSMSAAKTEFAPPASVSISAAVQEGSEAPSFSYQAIVLSFLEAESISMSPSPSISAAKTAVAASADVAISAAVKVGFALPSFSYQAMVSSA